MNESGSKRVPIGAVGERVRKRVSDLQERSGLSWAELARRCGPDSNLTEQALRRIVAGQRRVDVDDLVHIATAFEVSASSLLGSGESAPTKAADLFAETLRATWAAKMEEMVEGAQREVIAEVAVKMAEAMLKRRADGND